jgi:hypothetical protein
MATKKTTPSKTTKTAKTAAAASAAPQVTQAQAVTRVISPALQELIGRAITDKDFRETLFKDQATAVKGYKLTKIDLQCLGQIKPEQIEQQATTFAKKLNVYVFVQITIHF